MSDDEETWEPVLAKVARWAVRAHGVSFEEAYSDAAYAFVEARSKYDPARGPLEAFVWGVAKRGILNGLRTRAPLPLSLARRGVRLADTLEAMRRDADVESESSDGLELALDRLRSVVQMRELVQRLPEPDRSVVRAIELEELTAAEVAEQRGISRSRVSRIRARGVQRLRALLSGEHFCAMSPDGSEG